jgi:hypothetical protein
MALGVPRLRIIVMADNVHLTDLLVEGAGTFSCHIFDIVLEN